MIEDPDELLAPPTRDDILAVTEFERLGVETYVSTDDGSLEGYTAGQPFPMDEIDCTGDPQAGAKIMWNFDYKWGGAGASTTRSAP